MKAKTKRIFKFEQKLTAASLQIDRRGTFTFEDECHKTKPGRVVPVQGPSYKQQPYRADMWLRRPAGSPPGRPGWRPSGSPGSSAAAVAAAVDLSSAVD